MADDIRLMRPFVDILPLDLTCGRPTRPVFFARLVKALIRDKARAVFSYFVCEEYTPYMALLLRMLGRGLMIATGGTDSTYVEDIEFGALGSRINRWKFALTMRLADSVLPFSDSARSDILKYGKPRRMRTAYMSVDSDRFTMGPSRRPRRALTVALSLHRVALLQKGIAPFVQAAELVPDVEFIVLGSCVDDAARALRETAPPNVRFVDGFLGVDEYVALLQSAAVYVQASGHEGFGVALAEAMACGCVPVVVDRYSMPEVVGETGFVVPFRDRSALADAVLCALSEPDRGRAARQRVQACFTPEKRQRLLVEELETTLGHPL
jgi:glycosyltransferase involved in cell wall biosynthesis